MSYSAQSAPSKLEMPLLDLADGISLWNAEALEEQRRNNNSDGHADRLMQTIDKLGILSQMSQGVNTALTSVARLRENRQALLYLLCQDGYGIGILKVGVKKLFVTHPSQHCLVKIAPLCVLDFFVDGKCQRRGYGRQLFECMLAHEKLRPEQVAIDRPSTKFIAFLHRHYGLVDYTPQSNKFVVFHRYFDRWQPPRRGCEPNPHGSPTAPLHGPRGAEPLPAPPPAGPAEDPPAPAPAPLPPPGQKPKTPYELQYEAYVRQEMEREQRHKEWQMRLRQGRQGWNERVEKESLAQADFSAAVPGTEPNGINNSTRAQ